MEGYQEIDHTADWALRVWAPDLERLFIQAAAGMFDLMGVRVGAPMGKYRRIVVEGPDDESLLVAFLSELLLINEGERLALAPAGITIQHGRLWADCSAAPVSRQQKEIKAVTYHELEIRAANGLLETVLVFDV